MAMVQVTAKYQENIGKKPRVYFTCHPEDLDRYFNRVCEDLWRTHDCAVYYTTDMMDAFTEENLETDLGRNNLFVVPVTRNLLTRPNRAMDKDIPYAIENHIPVLPIMMEPGLDAIYSRPDKFGELQYLSPNGVEDTQISYENKLKKYLEAVLISDEMVNRIREAFDCYIFLSYRKKDRRYANELMRLIHANLECRDIAIWFDEFLTPGESFKEGIDRILHDSKLFALLVTPNLLEMPNGKPNFVMGEEYPAAKKAGLEILPAEMVSTDQLLLNQKFQGLPDCVDPTDTVFRERLLEAVKKLAIPTNNTPEHDFLIGMAYLDGIDVEVNREYALELITAAAEAGNFEAMVKLYEMYEAGVGVPLDYRKAAVWAEKIAAYAAEKWDTENEARLVSIAILGYAYSKSGDYEKSLKLTQDVYSLYCETLGEEHPDTLTALRRLADSYSDLGDYQNALELSQRAYTSCCKVLGEEHPETSAALSSLAMAYGNVGDYQKSLELSKTEYALCCKILGEEHPEALISLNNLAIAYGNVGNYQKSLELNQKVYALRCKMLGEEHPDTILALSSLGYLQRKLGDHQKGLELSQRAYNFYCKVLGEEHPDSIHSLNHLVAAYENMGDYENMLELKKKAYALYCKVLGEEHPDTLMTLFYVAILQKILGDFVAALENGLKAYESMYSIWGDEDPDTMRALKLMAICNENLGNIALALEQYEKLLFLETEKTEPSEEEIQLLQEAIEEVKEKLKA